MLVSMLNPLLIISFTEFVEKGVDDLVPEDYRMATVVACGIVGMEMVERFAHAVFDFLMSSAGILAGKSLKVMLFSKNFRMSSTGKRNYTFA